jgi:hypothetical protein
MLFNSHNVVIRTTEWRMSGQLSNQSIREEIYALWSMTRHFG